MTTGGNAGGVTATGGAGAGGVPGTTRSGGTCNGSAAATGGTGGMARTGGSGSGGTAPTGGFGTTVRLTAGTRDQLVGGHVSACSHAENGTDRWCAFYRNSSILGRMELWVINVSERLRGGGFQCNRSSVDCLLLTTNLWTGQPTSGSTHPFAHKFTGDTLLFHADAVSGPDELFTGFIYAWRIGWPETAAVWRGTRG